MSNKGSNAIAFNVLKVKKGMMAMEGLPFGIQDGQGRFEALSEDVINELYNQQLEVDDSEDATFFNYGLDDKNSFLHIGVPSSELNGGTWRDIFKSNLYVITLIIEGKPQLITTDVVVMIHNIINSMK